MFSIDAIMSTNLITVSPSARSRISAAAPAAVRRWPMFDFTEPITHCPGVHPSSPQSILRLSSSTASPTGVPVAWHST